MSEPTFRELMGEERSVGFDQVGITVASPESIRIYTRVSDEQVLADYDRALRGRA